MKNIKKKNRIILCICSIFVLVASIFSFIPLTKESNVVYADTVTSDYLFSGSNISSKTTFNKGLFTKQLLQNTLNGFELVDNPNGQNIVIYEKERDVNYPLCFYFKGINVSYPINSSGALWKFDYSDGTVSYLVGTMFNENNQSYKHIFDGSKDLVRITLLNWCDNVGTLDFAQLEEGDSFTGFVPYENSTYLNYEFDFSSVHAFENTFELVGSFNINGGEYRLVYSNNYQMLSSIWGNWQYFQPNIYAPGSVITRYFSRYYSDTNTLDNNYMFKLYTVEDYIGSTTNPYFIANISYVVLGSYLDANTYFANTYDYDMYSDGFNLHTSKYNFISYVDFHGNNFSFIIPLESPNSYDYFTYRTYYINSLADSETQKIYDSGYNNGYNTGYKNGETAGNDNGYKNGYNTGKNDGYNLGYNTAIGNEKYSFTALISSVIDVPVKAFTSLFNFEILGINLSGFFLGLLTCCIVIGVIRLIL